MAKPHEFVLNELKQDLYPHCDCINFPHSHGNVYLVGNLLSLTNFLHVFCCSFTDGVRCNFSPKQRSMKIEE